MTSNADISSMPSVAPVPDPRRRADPGVALGDARADVTQPDELTLLPMTGMTFDDARRKLSGLHFAQEALTPGEKEILYIAEALLRHIDAQHPRGYAR